MIAMGAMFLWALIIGIITVVPFWLIFSKAGFPGVLSLLILVPIANVVVLFYLAFAEWPALRERRQPSGLQ